MRGILRRLIGCRQRFISSSGRSSELGQTLMVSSAATVSYSTFTLMEKPNLLSGFPVASTLLPDLHAVNHYRNFSTPSSSGPPNIVSIESEEQFNTSLRKVQDESLPAIFYFTAVWCGPCRLLSPVIGQLSEKYPHVTTYKVDIDKNFFETRLNVSVHSKHIRHASLASPYDVYRSCLSQYNTMVPSFPRRFITTGATSVDMVSEDASLATPRIKFKRLDKTAKHIMQILDKEAVGEVRAEREIPDIKPGYIIQLKVEVPENKRRVSTVKGIVIARRNAGLNTTFRLRRLVAGVGVENLFHLYSPNLKEIKVLDKKKVRRAKLYYLRDKMNALKKH